MSRYAPTAPSPRPTGAPAVLEHQERPSRARRGVLPNVLPDVLRHAFLSALTLSAALLAAAAATSTAHGMPATPNPPAKPAAPAASATGAAAAGATAPAIARVVAVHDAAATDAFKPRPEVLRRMAVQGITNLTRTTSARAAWATLLSTNDTVGIKVHSGPGPDTGTRPPVIAALVEQLLEFGLPPARIIVWDRQRADLRAAGYFELAAKYGIRIEGSVNAGFDTNVFYNPDQPVIGPMVWSDVEFGQKGESAGRRSFVSKLVTREMTKIVIVTPLLNHNSAGVFGHLYSLALGSVDNTLRFENDLLHLKTAVPEIYALPALGDRVALCLTDALVCQYEGEQRGLLHYSAALNELRFSRDPVALDLLSLRELERQRTLADQPPPQHPSFRSQVELLENASLLELGTSDDSLIRVDHVP